MAVYRIGQIILLLSLLLSCAIPSFERKQVSGVYHRVKKGETLYSIARAYKTNLQYLAEVNNIENSEMIEAGRILFIPDARQIIDEVPTIVTKMEKEKKPVKKSDPIPKKPTGKDNEVNTATGQREQTPAVKSVAPPVKEKAKVSSKKSSEGSPTGEKTTAFPKTLPGKENDLLKGQDDNSGEDAKNIILDKKRFIWPVKGKVVSRYGIQPNGMFFNGIKIVTRESSVIAAADGTVILSSLLKDFGETIFMKHDDNYVTVYTNLGQRLVKLDDQVKKGSAIATLVKADQKGESSVYFEIRYMNKARNPLFFLP